MRMLIPFRGAPAALRAAATRVAPRAAVAAFPRTTFPVRAFSHQSDDDNHANQLKGRRRRRRWGRRDDPARGDPADADYDTEFDYSNQHDDDHDYDNDNRANQNNPNNDANWESRGMEKP
ncbi:hypothetical protein T484DRAFT_1742168 [Baffinella frigidus]|nr:hypothetical protein T484DRAFT_1742168 [Cryptophyta sp. CCMP2293]